MSQRGPTDGVDGGGHGGGGGGGGGGIGVAPAWRPDPGVFGGVLLMP